MDFGGPMGAALVVAVLIGLATGAEGDLLAFLAARQFGLRSYGAIYGVLAAMFGIGMGLAPWLAGHAFEVFQSYVPILWADVICLAVSALLLGSTDRFATVNRSIIKKSIIH